MTVEIDKLIYALDADLTPLRQKFAQVDAEAAASAPRLRGTSPPTGCATLTQAMPSIRGASPNLVQATLGHASLSTTSRYLHARPGDSSARYLAVCWRRSMLGGCERRAAARGTRVTVARLLRARNGRHAADDPVRRLPPPPAAVLWALQTNLPWSSGVHGCNIQN